MLNITNNMEEIYFKNEAKEKLLNGINKLCDAVSSTMGPNGKTVIIPSKKEYGKYIITKDGVSVAEQVFFKDPIENIGAEFVKEASKLTADLAGDGTTTATVLATAFINNLKDFEPNEITKAFDEIIPKVIEQLKENSRTLDKSDVKYVASISANNDMEIGNNIQTAYNFSNIVKIEESNNEKDEVLLVDGTKLDVSYFSKQFITNQDKAECEFSEPLVLLLDGKLTTLEPFEEPIKQLASQNKSLLIITEDISEQTLHLLETNVKNGYLSCCVIKTPGFSQHRKDLIKDLSDLTGATVIDNLSKRYNSTIFGKLKSVKVTKNYSLLVKHDDIDIQDVIESLDILRKSKELSERDLDLINQRYENLAGKIALIKVGGRSEIEMKERYDRYEDAVKAVACALEEGIVEGGGYALIKSTMSLHSVNLKQSSNKILESLYLPYTTIFGENKININNEEIITFNLSDNMFDQNIIDPLKVTRTALENAVSVAKTILSTDAIVLNEIEWNKN